jgi:hypothetical protein
MATHEAPQPQNGVEGDGLIRDDQSQKDEANDKVENVKPEMLQPVAPVNEKTMLQDQTNLLPVKQLLVVFVGLSCALFCE